MVVVGGEVGELEVTGGTEVEEEGVDVADDDVVVEGVGDGCLVSKIAAAAMTIITTTAIATICVVDAPLFPLFVSVCMPDK